MTTSVVLSCSSKRPCQQQATSADTPSELPLRGLCVCQVSVLTLHGHREQGPALPCLFLGVLGLLLPAPPSPSSLCCALHTGPCPPKPEVELNRSRQLQESHVSGVPLGLVQLGSTPSARHFTEGPSGGGHPRQAGSSVTVASWDH